MTWNAGGVLLHERRARMQAISEEICRALDTGVHVVALQEAFREPRLLKQVEMRCAARTLRWDDGVALVLNSKLLDIGRCLAGSTSLGRDGYGWPRGLRTITCPTRRSRTILRISNTHLTPDFRPWTRRHLQRQIQTIARWMRQRQMPFDGCGHRCVEVLVGDFNVSREYSFDGVKGLHPSSMQRYQIGARLAEHLYANCRDYSDRLLPVNVWSVDRGNNHLTRNPTMAGEPSRNLDGVCVVAGGRLVSAEIRHPIALVRRFGSPLPLSDHYPLLVDIAVDP